MANSAHAWVADVLLELVKYADLVGLSKLSDQCRMAYDAAVEEVVGRSETDSHITKKQHFVDILRELIDYAQEADLPKTRDHLILALASAANHLNAPTLGEVVVKFPP